VIIRKKHHLYQYQITGFPRVLENLENNKFIFQVLEFYNVLEKNIACENIQKSLQINIMPVQQNFDCRRNTGT